MRAILPLAALGCCVLVQRTPAREPDPAVLCRDAADSLACADLVEPRILATEPLARREGAALTLVLEDRRGLSFVDGEPAPGADRAATDVRYRLFGHVPRAGLWIVLGRWQDGERLTTRESRPPTDCTRRIARAARLSRRGWMRVRGAEAPI